MKSIPIEIIDSRICRTNKFGKDLLMPGMYINASFKRKHRYGSTIDGYKRNLIDRQGRFLTGWLPRVKEYARKKGLPLSITGELKKLTPIEPYLKAVPPFKQFREDQLRQIRSFTSVGRGVLKAPTGSGKTILLCGVMSCYPKARTLYLCHLLDAVYQTAEEIEKFGLGPVGTLKDRKRITVSTVQSFKKEVSAETINTDWDLIIVDEGHHVSTLDGLYSFVLNNLDAPARLALTATMPYLEEAKVALEGAIGPMLDELSFKEAVEKEIIVSAKVIVRKVPKKTIVDEEGEEVTSFKSCYKYGIVEDKSLHRMVMKDTKDFNSEGKTVLIVVVETAHAKNLMSMAKTLGVEAEYIWGGTDIEERLKVKKAFNSKETMCVITTVWKEAINIPTLNVVIPAGLSKSELALLQAIGRGIRNDHEKEGLIVVDYFNQNSIHFIKHFGERVCLYCDYGWL